MEIKTAIFHGPSGSGKDTQLDLLEDYYDFIRIGTSFVMTELKKENDPLALKADEYGKQGKLYPDELVYGMFEKYLERIDSDKKWFFVGPVRKETQIKLFDDLVEKYDRKLDLFVHFSLSEEAAIERMSLRSVCPDCNATFHSKYKKETKKGICDECGGKLIHREDDKPEAISKRLSWYNDDLQPILDEYRSRGILMEVDASRSIEDIHKDLLDRLEKYEQ